MDELKNKSMSSSALKNINKVLPTTQTGVVQEQLKEQIKLDLIDELRDCASKIVDFKFKELQEISERKEPNHEVDDIKEELTHIREQNVKIRSHAEAIDKVLADIHKQNSEIDAAITDTNSSVELKSDQKDITMINNQLKSFSLKTDIDILKSRLEL